jgi:CDP-diacylglycerol--serine O-phosphatidyltransferase
VRINLRKSLFVLPNLFTLSSVFCGFYASVLCTSDATEDELYRAALLIIFAIFFDTIDGRVARLTRTQSAFGLQIDSLADVVSFGVAPALLVYRWSLEALGAPVLAVFTCFCFVGCGAIRLARYNVQTMSTNSKPHAPSKYMVGLPIPGAAGILVSLVVANHAAGGTLAASRLLILCVVLVLSVFMVSTIKFRSFKDLRLSWRTVALVSFAVGSSAFIALRFHVAYAFIWLLASYVTIGLVEAVVTVTARVMKRRRLDREPEDSEA